MYYLGINAFSHHSSAAIVSDAGELVAAVEEERYSRIKEESRFPIESINYCLQAAGIKQNKLGGIAFGWSPRDMFLSRLILSQFIEYPVNISTLKGTGNQLYNMLRIRNFFEHSIGHLDKKCIITNFPHHLSHASSAFFSSPFEQAAYLVIDGRGERQVITWGIGSGSSLKQVGAHYFPHSVGKLYSAISRYLGFFGPERTGTIMALAAYGSPTMLNKFYQLASWNSEGDPRTFRLNLKYFDLRDTAQPSPEIATLFGHPARKINEQLNSFHKDVAATLQHITQSFIVSSAIWVRKTTGMDRLVMAGGVALNTVANSLDII